MRKSILTVTAAALAVTLAAGADAEAPAVPTGEATIAVPYADLDLTKPAGTAVLDARIDRALDKVCAKPDLRLLKATREFEACTSTAKDAAMEQLSLANPFDGLALASLF